MKKRRLWFFGEQEKNNVVYKVKAFRGLSSSAVILTVSSSVHINLLNDIIERLLED